ncbi:MAG: DUF1501 domain-containing protein [Chthonomonas sp.]|nr:DUF1501 domain-containing protein [Chthonomonas sp.]
MDWLQRELNEEEMKLMTRRQLFSRVGYGIGWLALAHLMDGQALAAPSMLDVRGPHFAPKAKRVVFMFMAGAPSQLDLFEPKPVLMANHMKPCPDEYIKDEKFPFIVGKPNLLGSPYKYKQHGQSGAWISEVLPHIAQIADDITIVRSMSTEQVNHAPAQIFMNTGFHLPGRPSMGSWMTYGLGTDSKDLPGFLVLLSGQNNPDGGKCLWSSGFLPTLYQGAEFRAKGDPVMFLNNPDGVSDAMRRRALDTLKEMNQQNFEMVGDPEIATRINSFEMAYRMQSSVPDLVDLKQESQATLDMYGAKPGEQSYANNCLLARRMLERGSRFVQLYHRGWDSHGTGEGDDLMHSFPHRCREVDQASAALVKDLKQRGMLDDTLVIWGGEFGRTPMNEARHGSTYLGRDHHGRAFTIWMAGGGTKAGVTVGETDDIGYNITADPITVHDLHATILHLMGLDHTKLTYRFQGRNFRLTDVFGEVKEKLLR